GRAPASAGPRRLAPLRARPALGVSVGEQQSHYCDTEQNKTDRAHAVLPVHLIPAASSWQRPPLRPRASPRSRVSVCGLHDDRGPPPTPGDFLPGPLVPSRSAEQRSLLPPRQILHPPPPQMPSPPRRFGEQGIFFPSPPRRSSLLDRLSPRLSDLHA